LGFPDGFWPVIAAFSAAHFASVPGVGGSRLKTVVLFWSCWSFWMIEPIEQSI
jgi:hypothetical protein